MRGKKSTRERLTEQLSRRRVLAALGGLGGLGAAVVLLGGGESGPGDAPRTATRTETIAVPEIGQPPTRAASGGSEVEYNPLNRIRGFGGEPACRWTMNASEVESGRLAWELEVGTPLDTVDTPLVLGRDVLVLTTGESGRAARIDPLTGTNRGPPVDLTLTTEATGDGRAFTGDFQVLPGGGLVNNHLVVPVREVTEREATSTATATVAGTTSGTATATGTPTETASANTTAGNTTRTATPEPPSVERGYRMFRVTEGELIPVNQLVRSVPDRGRKPRQWVTGIGRFGFLPDPLGGVIVADERQIATAVDIDALRTRGRRTLGGAGTQHPGVVAAAQEPQRRAYVDGAGTLQFEYEGAERQQERAYESMVAPTSVTIVGDRVIGCSPLVGETGSTGLHAFTFEDGVRDWTQGIPAHSVTASYETDTIVAATPGGLVCVDPAVGEVQWEYVGVSRGEVGTPTPRTGTPPAAASTATATPEPTPTPTPSPFGASPLNNRTSDLRDPTVELAARADHWVGTPVVTDESVYVTVRMGDETRVDRLSLSDGSRVWRSDPLPPTQIPHLGLAQGVVLVPIATLPETGEAEAPGDLGTERPRIVGIGG